MVIGVALAGLSRLEFILSSFAKVMTDDKNNW